MLPNNFIFSQTESLFQSKLDSNEIKNEAIAFMADTGRIWTHGTWFATPLTAEDIQNLIEGSTTLVEYIQTLSPAEVSVSDTQPSGEEKIWVNGNSISFKNGDSWSTPIDFDNFLSKDNTLEYTPAGDYNPATKKYVDDQITERDNVLIIDYTDLVGSPINETVVSNIIEAAQEGKAVILKADSNLFNVTVGYSEASNTLELNIYTIAPQENGYDLSVQSIIINTLDNTLTSNSSNAFTLVNTGDGLKYLSDDGTYKTFPDMATVVELNSAVLTLTNESSSEDIIAAFDSAAEFSNLITQIRDSDNIVNEVLLDTDGYIGHINASLAVSKTDEIIHIRFIDNNDKLVFITVTNNTGTFSCTRTESNLVENVELVSDGDGNLFLANDGTYKEAGDKTNVLILSLENDLANGQKDSPINAEVSASLVDAITTGKACVIKSANSDILANLQQIGNNVTIIMEQISRVGQTFVAVNTSITVNTSTNVIADYQTGAIVLETEGDGSKFLSNDGTYKIPALATSSSDGYMSKEDKAKVDKIITNGNGSSYLSNDGTYKELDKYLYDLSNTEDAIELYNKSGIVNNITYCIYNGSLYRVSSGGAISSDKKILGLSRVREDNLGDKRIILETVRINIYSDGRVEEEIARIAIYLETKGNGSKFLSDNGKYLEIPQPDLTNYLAKNNTTSYTPTADYHPATKKYVDDHSADMSNYLAKDNTTEYEPEGEYNPATKGYVDQELINIFYGHVVAVEDIMDGTRSTGRYTYREGTLYDAITFTYNGDPVGVIVIPCRFQEDQGGGPQTWTSEYPYKSTCIININGSYIEITISAYLNPVSGAATPYQLWVDFSWKYLYRVMTESEYSALGDSTASDNVLYFITPD